MGLGTLGPKETTFSFRSEAATKRWGNGAAEWMGIYTAAADGKERDDSSSVPLRVREGVCA